MSEYQENEDQHQNPAEDPLDAVLEDLEDIFDEDPAENPEVVDEILRGFNTTIESLDPFEYRRYIAG